MKKKSTHAIKKIVFVSLTFIVLFLYSLTSKTYAQISCSNENVLFLQTFGTGTTATSDPDVITSALTFYQSGSLAAEATYRVINNTQQKPEWHFSEDHTPGDIDGKMMVINGGNPATYFYIHQVTNLHGFAAGSYTAGLYLMNVDTLGVCGPNALLPDILFKVEYLSAANTWEPFTGSPYPAAAVPQSATATWIPLGSSFTLPSTDTFVVTNIRISIGDASGSGCGNDFAIDDIKLSQCPEGGPLPVQLLNITAYQKGSGVSVEWATAQENNSSLFEVERSSNGNTNWSTVASVNAAGNSSTVKNYNAYDAKPSGGANFYRLKQIDKDGVSKYSKTVVVNINLSKTGVSVLTNPFHNSVTVDFLSSTDQSVSVRLVDITGKQVAVDKWSIQSGSTRKELSNVSTLQQGIYLLTVSDAHGQVLYNDKVIKQ